MNADPTPDAVLTLEEVAAFLKVSETTAYTLARAGELPGRKVGREWRFLRSRVVAYLEQGGEEGQGGAVALDEHGGEYKVEGGQEYVALWLPVSREQKAQQIERAAARGTTVSALVTEFLATI